MQPPPKSQNTESYADVLGAQLSNLHSRLVATLDALDEITRNHEMELASLHDQARYLRAKCQVFKARAKEAEAERDELKADVNKLVEKVEIANDHRVLPHSRIHLPHPLVPLPPEPSIRLEEDVKDAYFPAILNSLNAELATEKYSFSELQRVSEARIATLEAQVARREAELYAYKPCSCRSGATSEPFTGAHKTTLQPVGITLPKTQYTSIENETAMRQRTLEVEIDALRRKLQSAQSETFPPKIPLLPPLGLQDTETNLRNLLTSRSTTRHVQPDPTNPALSDIGRQLARISEEADFLQAEQDNVKAAVNAGREDDGGYPDDPNDENFKGVLLIEEECIRLRESERSLRQELFLATAAASATEQSLKLLVKRLRRQIHMLRNPDTSGVSTHSEEVGMDPEEESLNNGTSEDTITSYAPPFLTPPLRSSTPPAQSSRTAISLGRRTDDPNYESPSSDRPPSAPPLFPSHDPVGRLARIDSELNQARIDVKEKDEAISSLRGQLAALQKAAQARTLRERRGSWRRSDSEKNG